MHKIDLLKIDLNLLVTFDVLMQERSVTRAAAVLNRSQSAISHALQRLREQLNDPLLVKLAGGMQATPYALALEVEVRNLLKNMARLLTPKRDFRPGQSDRSFRIVMPDLTATLFQDLHKSLQEQAPFVNLEWSMPTRFTMQDIAQGLVDLALLPGAIQRPDGIAALAVQDLAWACGMRTRHPALKSWNRSTWESAQHAMVRIGDALHNPIARLTSQGTVGQRRVQTVIPCFGAVGPVLAGSDLIATMPYLVLHDMAHRHGLVLRPVPFKMAAIRFVICWPASQGNDSGTIWLRDLLRNVLDAQISQLPSPTR